MNKGVVYKTTDGGENWNLVWEGDNLARYVWIDPRNSDVVYVSTGIFDGATVKELNGPPHDRQIETVLVNMERWRWMPRDLGKAHVVVNLPDFSLKVLNNGTVAWTTRIVIGKPAMPTPLLSETMKYITVNPTWNVPPSIVQNEYLPALAQDPTVLERMGLHLVNRTGGHGAMSMTLRSTSSRNIRILIRSRSNCPS